MRVQDVMSDEVRTIQPSATAGDAWEYMRSKNIHHLVVTDGGQIVGVLSERDAGGRSGRTVRAGRTVADLMTRNVVSVERTDTVRRAASVMRGRAIGCLPVTRGRKLVGIVTTADLLELLGRGVDRPSHADRHTLNYRVPHRRQARGVW